MKKSQIVMICWPSWYYHIVTGLCAAVLLCGSRGAAQEESADVSVESFHNSGKHANVRSKRDLVEEAGEQPRVALNFQDVDIPVLARFVSELTKKNFIVDEKVRGKVTVISPTKVTPDEAYTIFQSVLQVKGFTTVPSGNIIKIVPSRDAKQSGLLTVY